MKRFGFFCTVLSVALPLWLNAESISNGKAVLEWKDGVMELRPGGGKAGKVIFRPRFTNGVDIKTATVSLILQGKKAILLLKAQAPPNWKHMDILDTRIQKCRKELHRID